MISVQAWLEDIESEKPHIQRLRIESSLDDSFDHFTGHEIRDCPNIKEVHLVCTDGLETWRQAVEDHYYGTYNVKFFDETPEGLMLDWEGMKEVFPSVHSDDENRAEDD